MVVRRVGAGPEVVWIHGLGESSLGFDATAARFAGFTHVLVDLPGYGRSAWRDTSLDELAGELATWLAKRAPAILIGHSMGGVLATLIAERTTVRAIVNIDGNLSPGDCTFSAQAGGYTAEDFVAGGFDDLCADVYRRGVDEPPLRGYHAAMYFASPLVFHHHAAELVAMSGQEDLAARLGALPAPALFVAGVPGGICAHSRGLLDHHRVRWVGLEPAGHWAHVDRVEEFATVVGGFLGEL
jgi:pimeloyl-ACP methyl ester carboxylesterase